VVADGISGRLTPLGDAPSLASAIAELVANPALRRRLGDAGRQKATADFDQQRVIDITLEAYDRLLGRSRPRQVA
jgi:glycosyltransferase involved in cell wall biosynthesis